MNATCFALILLGVLINQTACSFSYYHELSRILLQAEDHLNHNETDFGFAIEYQSDVRPKLLIGAPRYDLDGKVYTCDIEDCLKKEIVTCLSVNINIQELANTTRNVNPNQHFYLGAAIAAVKNYFLTCAPLWTFDGIDEVLPGTYGTCFLYNGTGYRYNGVLEKRIKDGVATDPSLSGYGWNALADEMNGYILITKPVVHLDILTLPSNNPFDEANSLRKSSRRISDYMSKKYNLGYGLAAGQFFGAETTYAFSFTDVQTKGVVAFLKYKHNTFSLVTDHSKTYTITSDLMGSLFGASLCSANIDQIEYSELIVGAPGHIDGLEDLEVGAVHIYSMMQEKRKHISFMGIIFGSKDGSRFGATIAADDVDGDKFPEIFISAPFEESEGVVYILSGAEINEVMVKSKNKFVHLSDLRHTQRIIGEGHRKFGYSLKIIPDIDENGCNELAVGSPGDSHVSLFKCIPKVLVKMNINLEGSQIVSEKANKFDVCVCINMSYQEKPANIISKILVTNNIIGDSVFISEPTFILDMAKKEKLICKNITVSLSNHDPADYKFTSKLDLHPETNKMLKSKDFKNNLAVLHPFSTKIKSLDIVRRCSGNECNPLLSVNVTWLGNYPYLLGSTNVENINITVQNMGHNSYGACLWIGLRGAKVGRLDCSEDETKTGYICLMPKPLRMYKHHEINVILNMSRPLSTDKSLDVDVKLYEDCENKHAPVEKKNLAIPYYVTDENVLISGLSTVRNVSDKQLNNEKLEVFDDNLEYSIFNNGSVTWLGLQVTIIMKNYTYISGIKILAPETDTCVQQDDSDLIKFICDFDLKPNVTKKLIIVAFLSRDKLKTLFNESSVNTTSEAHLSFPSIKLQKIHRITSTIIFQKELSMGDNKLMIIIIGILLAWAILIIIVIVLYKCNFFQRKQKKKLEELKNTWRRRAMRQRRPQEHSEINQSNENQATVEESVS